MAAKDFIKYCRFYHGEGECPEEVIKRRDGEIVRWYESVWVRMNLDGEHADYFKLIVEEYNAYGMSDFSTDDGAPITLKALLFNRYYHQGTVTYGGEAFRQWYLKYYLGIGNHDLEEGES